MKYKTLSKREVSPAEKLQMEHILFLRMALNELYYNLSVFVAE
jgi:hypothetical protein